MVWELRVADEGPNMKHLVPENILAGVHSGTESFVQRQEGVRDGPGRRDTVTPGKASKGERRGLLGGGVGSLRKWP